ncbi:MAG: N-6 DNA methylase [Methanobacterium formicicum]
MQQESEFNLIKTAITYLRDDLGFTIIDSEVPFKMGNSKSRADIVVYKRENNQEIPYILVEVKAKQKIEKYAWVQAESFAKRLNTPYFAITNGNKWSWFKTGKIGESLEISINEIDLKGTNTETKRTIKNPKHFSDILKQMKDVVYNTEKLNPNEILYELIKIIFVKIECEKDQNNEFFVIDNNVKQSYRIKDFYQKRIKRYPNLLDPRLPESFFKINLIDKTIIELMSILSSYRFIDSNNNIISSFHFPLNFETKRRSRGNYYIPTELSQFLVNFLNPNIGDSILVPACNNGALLMEIINKKCEYLVRPTTHNINEEKISENINGIEVNPNLYWLTCMNLLIHGYDINGISILDIENFKVKSNFDKIYCFPPFGRLNQPHIFDECNFRIRSLEEFFLILSTKLLKKSGKMIIVLPDSVLTRHSATNLRNYLKEKMNILSIVSLPQNSNLNTSIKTSVLLLEKKDEFSQQGSVFMAILNPKSILIDEYGYDSILDDYSIFIEENVEDRRISKNSFAVNGNLILENDIISPLHYIPEYLEIKNQLNQLKSKIKLNDIAEKIANGNNIKDKYSRSENTVPLIKSKNIVDGKLIKNDLIYIKKNLPRINLWPPGTILISKIGKKNKIIILPSDFTEYAIDSSLIGIRLKDSILPEYLASFLDSKYGKIQLDAIKVNGIIPHINMSHLKNVIIPLHSIETQQKILYLKDKKGDEIFFEEVE